SADVAGDEPRVRAPERLGRETDAIRGPRRQVLHEHVRPRDKTPNERAVFRVLQVGDDRFLAPVEPHEVGAVAVHHVVVAAREVSSGALDLDHARTGVGHLARGERSGDSLLDADDERAFEGKRQNISRTSHPPSVPMIDIMSAPPSAQPNPSIFSESLNASVILRRIALMIHRLMNARSSAMPRVPIDRKSTRLNSSHVKISYAVTCRQKNNA